MKAIVKPNNEPGSVAVVELPTPKPKNNEVLIKIKATGICYTDVAIINGKYKGRKPVPIPIVLGHEGAGIVEEVGKDVKGLMPGDRVAFEALSGCGTCYNCLNGYKNMCNNWEHIGITCDGTFAEYIVINAGLVHKIPPEVSFIDAACLEPISLTVRTLEHVKPLVGDTVAIIGPGSIGLFHLQALKSAGASKIMVIGIEKDEKRLEIARRLGADHVINASKEDVVRVVRDVTDGLGADIVVEAANSPTTVNLAIEIAGARGRVAYFGLYPEATINSVTFLRSGLTLFGDVGLLPQHFIRAIRWVQYRKVVAEPLVSRTFRFEQVGEALDAFNRGESVKVMFED